MPKKKRKMRKDVRERLAAKRLVVARAYCKVMGYRVSAEERVIERLAQDTELASSTVTTVISGASSHMGEARILMLEAKLSERNADIADYIDDGKLAKQGVGVFANPKRKPAAQRKPMRSADERERLSELRLEVMHAYCREIGSPASSERAVVRRVAADSGYKPVSVHMVLRGCTDFSGVKLQNLYDRLGDSELDLGILRDPSAADLSAPAGSSKEGAVTRKPVAPQASGPTIVVPTTFPCAIVFDADGRATSIDAESFPGVIVIDEEGAVQVAQPPEGAVLKRLNVMEGREPGSLGVISIPFVVEEEE